MENNKSMPHSDELERSVLSACVHFPDDRAIVCEQLSAEDFYTTRNAELFGVVRSLHRSGAPCDVLLIREACGAKPNARALCDELGISLHPDIAALCERLRALSAARRVARAALEVGAAGLEATADPNAFLDRASTQLTKAIQSRDSAVKSSSLTDLCHSLADAVDQYGTAKAPVRLSSGLPELDRVLGGLEPGRLYVVAGRPGMGKSALAVQVVEAVAETGRRAAVFSLEMPAEEIVQRQACARARIDTRQLLARKLDDLEARRFTGAMQRLSVLPIIYPEASSITVEQIARMARQEKMRSGLGLVLVDYLQLIRSSRKHDNREQEVSEISRELKLLARELELPVIAVAQLNRDLEKRADKRPMMSDLRESGAIEQDADAIVFVYREHYYTPSADPLECELIVGKNRSGETGFVKVKFEAQYTRFGSLYREASL